jgi:hypothetical protein
MANPNNFIYFSFPGGGQGVNSTAFQGQELKGKVTSRAVQAASSFIFIFGNTG